MILSLLFSGFSSSIEYLSIIDYEKKVKLSSMRYHQLCIYVKHVEDFLVDSFMYTYQQ